MVYSNMSHCRPLCIVFLCMFLFSSSYGRPKDVIDMLVDVPVEQPEQVKPPTFTVRENQEKRNAADQDEKASNYEKPAGPPEEQEQKEDAAAVVAEAKAEEEEEKPAIVNVHDARARAVADALKQMPYKAGDTEEIMHGGGHVHGEEHEGHKQAIGVGGIDMADLLGTEVGKEEDKGAPSTIDTEQLMHDGDGGDHGHNPHEGGEEEKDHGPSVHNPEDLLHMRDMEFQAEERSKRDPNAESPEEIIRKMEIARPHQRKPKQEDGRNIGLSVEEVVHGDGGAHHDHEEGVMEEYVDEDGITRTRKLGKQITAEDIENLGLTKKDLEGINLSKLLRRDQSEYEAWKKEEEAEDKDKGFWERVDEFRNNYFSMLSQQIRHMSRFDKDEDPEWEGGFEDDEPHPGESRVDHESEMWGSTKPKGKRRRRTFTVIHRQTHDGTEEL